MIKKNTKKNHNMHNVPVYLFKTRIIRKPANSKGWIWIKAKNASIFFDVLPIAVSELITQPFLHCRQKPQYKHTKKWKYPREKLFVFIYCQNI